MARPALAALALTLLAGCAPEASTSALSQTVFLKHDGVERSYRLLVGENCTTAPPVLLAFHGSGGTSEGMCALTGLDAVAHEHGLLLVCPQGVENAWNDGRPELDANADDVGFVRAILDDLAIQHPFDRNRVCATGISNGGQFCFRLAYDLNDRIAAIAPVAALLSESLAQRTPPARATPALIIVGREDPITPYAGGIVGGALLDRGHVLSADQTLAFWTGTVGAEAVLLTVENGGHTWPGGMQYLPVSIVGRTSRDFSASERIWAFCSQYALP